MILFPAIDMKDGACVRLQKGEFNTVSRVADDPVTTARSFRDAGATHLHLVDLDGAKDGIRKNRSALYKTAAEFAGFTELGGGLRDMDSVRDALSNGISRVILGSAAFRDRIFLKHALAEFGDAIAVGIDAKAGLVSVAGWAETSRVGYLDFANECAALGVKNIIYTDIGRDGLLTGPDIDGLSALTRTIPQCNITASGGISSAHDITLLASSGFYGAITGKALYSGALTLADALEAASTPFNNL